MIQEIEGETLSVNEHGEQWEYFTTVTEKEVTGWLREKVLERVGKNRGRVTSLEDSSSYGTCEICGSYSEEIKLFVDGEEVYSGEDSSGMDYDEGYPNPFIRLSEWLEGTG